MNRSSNALAVFQAKQKEKYGNSAITLKLPGKTRWDGAVILLNSLIKNRSALQETVMADDLDMNRNVRKCVLENNPAGSAPMGTKPGDYECRPCDHGHNVSDHGHKVSDHAHKVGDHGHKLSDYDHKLSEYCQ